MGVGWSQECVVEVRDEQGLVQMSKFSKQARHLEMGAVRVAA